ncbi:hypothetical protein LY76DRAFT_259009 [Colletotrichum caudatum]|nr:hypothetical protein LY76DRAFT_259009 [Colletotrichum caudatum]
MMSKFWVWQGSPECSQDRQGVSRQHSIACPLGQATCQRSRWKSTCISLSAEPCWSIAKVGRAGKGGATCSFLLGQVARTVVKKGRRIVALAVQLQTRFGQRRCKDVYRGWEIELMLEMLGKQVYVCRYGLLIVPLHNTYQGLRKLMKRNILLTREY